MDPAAVDVDELIKFWILAEADHEQLIGMRGATAPGFALRECANRSGPAVGSGVPAVRIQARCRSLRTRTTVLAKGDVEVGDDLSTLGASGELVEVVAPGVGAFHRPTFGGLDRGGWPFVCNGALESPLGQQHPREAGVVAGIGGGRQVVSGSGPGSLSRSNAGASSGESCRFAGALTTPSGRPPAFTRVERLMPSLPLCWVWAEDLTPAGGLGQASIDGTIQ